MLADDIVQFLEAQREDAARLLCGLIGFHSVVHHEHDVQVFLYHYLSTLGYAPRYAAIDEDIVNDPDYTVVPGHKSYKGRRNVALRLPGAGRGRSLIVNSHSDVVPGTEDSFAPRMEGDGVVGRGACDAKGQLATMLLALRALKEFGVRLRGDLDIQMVIEEEPGGNGALSLIRQGHRADAALVMEPSGLQVCPANRGALWYKLSVKGRPVHMAKYWEGVNAIREMVDLIAVLQRYEEQLRRESRGHPLFSDDPSPVNVNLGTINGGDWPSTVAGDCVIEGGIAFLPNKRLKQIKEELQQAIEGDAGEWARDHYALDFSRLHNDAFETPTTHPAVGTLCAAADRIRGPQPPVGLVASCDARLFYHRGEMPTLVFGPGDLAQAHSTHESISVSEMVKAAQILTLFVMDWCGVA